MSDHLHVETYRGYRIVIVTDSDPQNPRKEQDNLGKMICFHGRYDLGDEHPYKTPHDAVMDLTGKGEDELGRHPNDDLGDGSEYRIIWEPLYLYDHSGITMSVKSFSCPWDSGQVGIIYCTYESLAISLGLKPEDADDWTPTAEQIAEAEAILQGEVKTYDTYIRNDVVGFQVYAPDDEASNVEEDEDPPTADDDEFWCDDSEDSCYGFYSQEDAIQSAKEAIDGLVNEG